MEDFQYRLQSLFLSESQNKKLERKLTQQVELRRNNRLDSTYNKRQITSFSLETEENPVEQFQLSSLESYIKCLQSQNKSIILAGVYGLRKIISNPQTSLIQKIIDSGAVLLVTPCMYQDTYPQLQCETAWLLGTLCIGSSCQIEYLLSIGCLAGIMHMLNSAVNQVKEHAFWVLGNLAESSKYRDLLLGPSVFPSLIQAIMAAEAPVDLIKQGCCTVSILCRVTPVPLEIYCELLVPPLIKALILHIEIEENLTDVLTGVLIITSTYPSLVSKFDHKAVVQVLVKLLFENNEKFVVLSLQILGNFTAGSHSQTDSVINKGLIAGLRHLYKSENYYIRREVVLCVSNICAGKTDQIEAIWESGLVLEMIREVVKEKFELKKEVMWVVFNLVLNGMKVDEMIEEGLFYCFIHLVSVGDLKLMRISLSCIEKILDMSMSDIDLFVEYRRNIIASGLKYQIDLCSNHKNTDVAELASSLIGKYFDELKYCVEIEDMYEISSFYI